ncbi:DUF3283 family protein [Parasalinivibrio latis]|uniref:DUF3283 family protein n=1 Tax=Parasalinivibrio latis TaxID=2952610 RepID=UPI0030E56F4D
MKYNLSLLDPETKFDIELDKQASFAVWKVKHGLAPVESLSQARDGFQDPRHKSVFDESVTKYRSVMSI